ncbi:hypothetical protein PIB30_111768 [Stylosanthes scabra]|uniref:Uncharacterized protein n=1 Tax=Stylosanthes scabra TaxID=79078 RepID=A0ABU6Y0G5_9FABA|nr:hypothetical protein [Stylosanthes scabra]
MIVSTCGHPLPISLIPHPSFLTTISQALITPSNHPPPPQAPNTAGPPPPPQAATPLVFPQAPSVLVVYLPPLRPVVTSSSTSHGNTPESSRVFVLVQSCEIQPPQHSSSRP